jgi:hypothetical protein
MRSVSFRCLYDTLFKPDICLTMQFNISLCIRCNPPLPILENSTRFSALSLFPFQLFSLLCQSQSGCLRMRQRVRSEWFLSIHSSSLWRASACLSALPRTVYLSVCPLTCPLRACAEAKLDDKGTKMIGSASATATFACEIVKVRLGASRRQRPNPNK